MKIYYQPQKKIFFHSDPSVSSLLFGKNSYVLHREDEPYKYGFDVSVKNNICGPVIGILAAKEKGSYQGNFPLFQDLQRVIQSRGGISFVFSLSDIGRERIEGLCFHEERNMWVSCSFPIPHFIYNRIPSPALEKTEEFSAFLQWAKEKNITFFNPHFFNKWEVYQCLAENNGLIPHLPQTKLLQDKDELREDLTSRQKIYIKPVLSSKGKGIRLLELCSDGQIICKSTKKIEKFKRYDRLVMKYPEWFESEEYIYQEAIQCRKLNNHRYDLRVLVHFTGSKFEISGIGIRMSERQEVTTHVPQGGKILPFHHIESKGLVEKIEVIAAECGKQLLATYGLIGEFSMDLGIQEDNGELVVFEINSKPMKFDEYEIEAKRLDRLADSFFHFSRAARKLST
ncbi:YheC/YheD family protein [Bacillus salacetis]|uniref:YheC/YheD family endospore coat-associated protein n=1 Tax=Bacillus salacetis TaxID=2315464 RepID=UPI003B9E0446